MKAFRGCSALVIRCFKKVESFADWLTGAAGPLFVFFCWSLIGLGGIAFCQSLPEDIRQKLMSSRYDRKGSIMDIDNRTFAYFGTSPGEHVRTVLSSFNRSARLPLA
jgi:hypothetical protein